jgi:hypothetical protein
VRLVGSELVSGVNSLICSENAGKSARYGDLGAAYRQILATFRVLGGHFPEADYRESLRHDQGFRFSEGTLDVHVPSPAAGHHMDIEVFAGLWADYCVVEGPEH